MASYLVTGSTRGIGLALVSHLASLPSTDISLILATGRSPTPPPAISALVSSSDKRVHYLPLDVISEASISSAVSEAQKTLSPTGGLDVLINNAGYQPSENPSSAGIRTEDLRSALESNVMGVNSVISAFLPLLRAGKQKKIVTISSTVGSFALRAWTAPFPVPSYKISKATVNMLVVQWAQTLESEGFCVFAVSPGSVKTGLGGGDGKWAHLEPHESAAAVLDQVFKAGVEMNGCFRNILVNGMEELHGGWYNGKDVDW